MTIYRKAKRGELPAIKFGKNWLFPEDLMQQWILDHTAGGRGEAQRQKARGLVDRMALEGGVFGRIKGIRLVYAFGSAVSGHSTAVSDVDLAYLDDGRVDPLDVEMELERAVLEMMEKERRIDLVGLRGAPPEVRYGVIRDGVLLYAADDALRADFECRAVEDYLDRQPLLDRFYRDVRGREVA